LATDFLRWLQRHQPEPRQMAGALWRHGRQWRTCRGH